MMDKSACIKYISREKIRKGVKSCEEDKKNKPGRATLMSDVDN